jgi:uncharacterized protein
MKRNVVLSGRGQLTLPAEVREKFTLITSEYAVEEARRNISPKKKASLPELVSVFSFVEIVPDVMGICPITLPSKDQPIFLSALRARATHLLTGDLKDFGVFMNRPEKTCGILIQTVADFFASLKI